MKDVTRRQLIAGALAGGGLASLATPAGGQAGRSTLFREVSLVDGTGAPPRPANVLVIGAYRPQLVSSKAAAGFSRPASSTSTPTAIRSAAPMTAFSPWA